MDLLLFTIGPLTVMAIAMIYTVRVVHQLSDYRPLLLVALLGLMMLHQSTELVGLSSVGVHQLRSQPAEVFESGANLLASVASVVVVQHLEGLRTAEIELEVYNTALQERSAMITVLNRVLRHNVRNDLNVIAGQAANVATRVDDKETQSQLELIERKAWDLATVSNRTQRIKQLLSEEPKELEMFRFPDDLQRPVESVQVEASSATISLVDGLEDLNLTAKAPRTFPLAFADTLKQIVAYNDGAVTIDIGVSAGQCGKNDGDCLKIGINDDGDGFPDLDIQALEQGNETPLVHAEDLALWCLFWNVERADGILELGLEESTLEIHLPRSSNGIAH